MLCGVDVVLNTSLSAKVKGFLDVDRLNLTRSLLTILGKSFFGAYVGDFTCFGDKPKTIANSDDICKACFPGNLSLLLVIGPMFFVVTSRVFSTTMQNLDPSVFKEADTNSDVDVYFNANADTDVDPNLDVDANVNTDVDQDLGVDAYFKLIFLEAI